jgi:hypothetical protein
MNKQLLNRREFNGLCVALGSSFFSVGTMIVALPSASARAATPMVKFHDGTIVPALGQGSAGLAQGRHPDAAEEESLRTGLSLGMTLIDTAEMYGDGRSEKLIGRVIAGQRDRVFLVSKVSPNHEGRWNEDLFRVLEGFPDLTHDGEVDACSGALEMLNLPMSSWGVFEFYRRRAQELEEQRKPQPAQIIYAIGSMEWLAKQNKSK